MPSFGMVPISLWTPRFTSGWPGASCSFATAAVWEAYHAEQVFTAPCPLPTPPFAELGGHGDQSEPRADSGVHSNGRDESQTDQRSSAADMVRPSPSAAFRTIPGVREAGRSHGQDQPGPLLMQDTKPMTDDSRENRLVELLLCWEELREQGRCVTAD